MLKLYYGHIRMVKDQRVFDTWFKKMDSKRKEKILNCKQEADKQRSLLAGVLFNYGLENNRNAEQVFYSISHSGDYVICVLANRRVGVDIENSFRPLFCDFCKFLLFILHLCYKYAYFSAYLPTFLHLYYIADQSINPPSITTPSR